MLTGANVTPGILFAGFLCGSLAGTGWGLTNHLFLESDTVCSQGNAWYLLVWAGLFAATQGVALITGRPPAVGLILLFAGTGLVVGQSGLTLVRFFSAEEADHTIISDFLPISFQTTINNPKIMSYCTECGADLDPAEKFCHNCGHQNVTGDTSPINPRVAPPDSAASPAAVSTEPKKKHGCLKIAIIILIPLLFIVLAIIAFAFLLTKGPVESAKEHFATLKSGAVEQAYRQTSGVFQQSTSLENYQRFINAYPILRDVSDTRFLERSIENNEGVVKGTISDSQGNRVPITIKFIKEQGEWKILALDLPQGGASVVPTNEPDETQPTGNEPSIGKVIFGGGRKPDGSLIGAGQPVPSNAPKLSANVELINHPLGQRVQMWVKHLSSGQETQPIDAQIEGAGSGTITFDLDAPPGGNWPTGKWNLMILLDEKVSFQREFEVR